MHLPGVRNPLADFLSRRKPPPGEWRLHPEVVADICGRLGRAEMDLFASEESTHCPLWFSWTEVSGGAAICIPPSTSALADTAEGPSAGPQASAGGSLLAGEDLVSTAAQALLQLAMAPPR
ncbi:uncharacterized protein LOC121624267 [Scomber scombrus]|uniref:Uncharacterized protein LOC121624267 n=1 Tax=Scomber scombrus TaxID=13677 RepID=A0AAV1Q4X4_SCOSC